MITALGREAGRGEVDAEGEVDSCGEARTGGHDAPPRARPAAPHGSKPVARLLCLQRFISCSPGQVYWVSVPKFIGSIDFVQCAKCSKDPSRFVPSQTSAECERIGGAFCSVAFRTTQMHTTSFDEQDPAARTK